MVHANAGRFLLAGALVVTLRAPYDLAFHAVPGPLQGTPATGELPRLYWKRFAGDSVRELWIRPNGVEVGLGADSAVHIRHASTLHMGLVRKTLYWMPNDAEGDLRALRAMIAEAKLARVHGAPVRLLVTIHNPNVCVALFGNRAAAYRAFAERLRVLVREDMADGVVDVPYWELFNEEDADVEGTSTTSLFGARSPACNEGGASLQQQGTRYAEMLAVAYPVIRATSRNQAMVVAGGLTNYRRANGRYERSYDFLRGIYAHPAGAQSFDILAVHRYAVSGWTRAEETPLLEVLRANNDAERPVWLTEFGYAWETYWDAHGGPPARDAVTVLDALQRDFVVGGVRDMRSAHVYDKAFIHSVCFRGDTTTAAAQRISAAVRRQNPAMNAGDVHYGLLRRDCSLGGAVNRRPAYEDLAQHDVNATIGTVTTLPYLDVSAPGWQPSGWAGQWTVLANGVVRLPAVPVSGGAMTRIVFTRTRR